jgi:hypothetical protein
MVAFESRVDMLFEMGDLVGKGLNPDDAFNRIADRGCVSGKSLRSLRGTWKKSSWFHGWVDQHPGQANGLCWD